MAQLTARSLFLSAPAELRIQIYEYLFDEACNRILPIRNVNAGETPIGANSIRTRYHIMERSLFGRCYETTYELAKDDVYLCTALMRTNRQVYNETVHLIYARHAFDFGNDVEAVAAFLSDLRPHSRQMVPEISVYKSAPSCTHRNELREWSSMCRYLEKHGGIRKLCLKVQGGKPKGQWQGAQRLSVSDFEFLASIQHKSLEWVEYLCQIQGIQEIEVSSDVSLCPLPTSTDTILFAAFSASIEDTFSSYLRMQLGLVDRYTS
ncbi:hypothetical protein SUNI508_11710 [Seiridium unicorne]|uniref:DUF7730 domain-containing protein n=1 Tax=Seiridium unicorne TaxID=138068 RepID=A0ABR2UGL2_9PEZI